jgi:hypothetical protein
MPTPADSIATYIRAKDGNRPHLLHAAFAADATLAMVVRTEAISFPPASRGRDAIADTLVRRFNQSYENVYTLCLGSQPEAGVQAFSCDWLVAMSQKQDGAVRVGSGRYDWSFTPGGPMVSALTITIETMEVMPPDTLAPVMNWVSGLPYPWCPRTAPARAAPRLFGVAQALRHLGLEID